MEDETRDHLLKLARFSPGLSHRYEKNSKQRGPNDILVIMTYGEMGVQIADEFDGYDSKSVKKLFELIEEGMGGDYELSTAIATGLLEALYPRACDNGNWNRIKECLGSECGIFVNGMSNK